MTTQLIGVELSDGDLEAIRVLYRRRWSAEIYNWKERDTDYCMWFVRIPDNNNQLILETGQSLEETIYRLLLRLGGVGDVGVEGVGGVEGNMTLSKEAT